jgi:hypothetical protein
MSVFKRVICLCLVFTLVSAFFLIPAQAASFSGVKGPTLVKQNGIWYYVKNGAVCYDTSLVKFNNEWYYVKNGTVQMSANGLVKSGSGTWYYIQNGICPDYEGFVSFSGQKYYVWDGVVQTTISGAVEVNGNTYYLKNGVLTVCHSNGHAFSGGICTRCSVTDGSNPRATVVNWLINNGKYSDGDYSYYFLLSEDDEDGILVTYDEEDDELDIFSMLHTSDGSASSSVLLKVESGSFAVDYDGSVYCAVYGYIDPATYTDTTWPTFYKYEGMSVLEESMKDIANDRVVTAVYSFGIFLRKYVGLSLADMGYYCIN